MKRPSSYFQTGDGRCFPHPESVMNLEGKLRYRPDDITQNDKLVLASVCHVFVEMIRQPHERTHEWKRLLRAALAKPGVTDDAEG